MTCPGTLKRTTGSPTVNQSKSTLLPPLYPSRHGVSSMRTTEVYFRQPTNKFEQSTGGKPSGPRDLWGLSVI